MHKRATAMTTIFMSLLLIGIIVAIFMLLSGRIDIPIDTGFEQKINCQKTCESLGKDLITNATGREDCERMSGQFIDGLKEESQVCCCVQ